VRFPDPERSRAILIGTSKYQDKKLPDLPEVGRSVGDLADILAGSDDGVVSKVHCEVLIDEADIRLIGRKLRIARQAEDLLLVYYSGHGLIGGRRHDLYLALPDSEWAEPEFNSLEFEKLRSAVLDSPAATKVIILDCCFSGRAATESLAAADSVVLGQIEVDGTYVLTSAQRDQLALIVPGEEHTAFSGRLIELLRGGVPGGPEFLTIDDLFQELSVRMKAAGLSQPQRRATNTAGMLPLTKNHAFSPPLEPGDEITQDAAREESEGEIQRNASGSRRRWTGNRRQWMALSAILVVAGGAIGGVLKLEQSPGSATSIGQMYVIVAPRQVGAFSSNPSLGRQMNIISLLDDVIKSAQGQVSEAVSGVYQEGNSDPDSNSQIFMFVGGHLANANIAGSIKEIKETASDVRDVPAGSLGGMAACGLLSSAQSAQSAMCVWFDDDSFGELVSPTMTPAELANVLASVRPDFELPVATG
jgi:hypothetical protein